MAITHCNTTDLRDIATDINSLANEYEQVITKMFNRLANVPYETKEWIGGQSEQYFRTILMDKGEFLSLGENIKKYSNLIKNSADAIDTCIKNNNTMESR